MAEAPPQSLKDHTRALLAGQKPAMTYLLYFPDMRDVARDHGYALALHGSLARDFDLVAVPWADDASDADTLVDALCAAVSLAKVGGVGEKPFGRRAYTLKGVRGVPHGWVDLSVMPRHAPADGARGGDRTVTVGPVAITCMAPDARERMETALASWRGHLEDRIRIGTPPPKDPVYAFAYWLFRYSGLVTTG